MEKYEKPEMEVIEMNGNNIITASCGGCGFADMDGDTISVCTPDSCSSDTCMMNLW